MLVRRAVGFSEGDPVQERQLEGRHDGDNNDQDEPAWTSSYLGTAALVSAQTRTRRPSDTVDRLERATPRSDHERAQIEGRLKFDFLTGTA